MDGTFSLEGLRLRIGDGAAAEPPPRIRTRPAGTGGRRHGLSFVEALGLSLQALVANKLRSFLTMLGVIIGVSAVIVMLALGQGVARATEQSIKKLGTNVLSVRPAEQSAHGVKQGLGSALNLKLEYADLLARQCPSVKAVSPEYRGDGQVKYGDQNTRTAIQGAYPIYFQIRNIPIADGRAFTMAEVKQKARVAVIGDNVRDQLFGSRLAVGKEIRINGKGFLVVGVAEKRGSTGWRSPDDQVTVPTSTAMLRLFGSRYANGMSVQAVSEDRLVPAEEEIQQVLRKALRLRPEDSDPVRVFNQADVLESAHEQNGFLTMLLAGIAMVSLIVGGIGIMNIMLVSVTERTREIGIRKAIGAKRKDILYQFLIESVTMSLVGGLIGIGLGVAVALWMATSKDDGGLGFPMLLSVTPMIVSFCFSALVGVFFGIYPAMKASALDPIHCLRAE